MFLKYGFICQRSDFSYTFLNFSLFKLSFLLCIQIVMDLLRLNWIFHSINYSFSSVSLYWLGAKGSRTSRACLHCDRKLRGLDAGLLKRRVINFADPESQKGFVYLPFLFTLFAQSTSFADRFRLVLSAVCWRIPFFFCQCRFSIYPPVLPASPAYLCPSLHFQLCSIFTHRNSVPFGIQCADTVVQLKSSSDRKLQYSGSCTEKRRPELGERYRQLLRDRINRMESKNMKYFK